MAEDRTYHDMSTDQLVRFAQSAQAPTDQAERKVLADELMRRKPGVVTARASSSNTAEIGMIHIVLYVLGGGAAIFGLLVLVGAESALHEIEAFILFLIGAVFVCGAAVVSAVGKLGQRRQG